MSCIWWAENSLEIWLKFKALKLSDSWCFVCQIRFKKFTFYSSSLCFSSCSHPVGNKFKLLSKTRKLNVHSCMLLYAKMLDKVNHNPWHSFLLWTLYFFCRLCTLFTGRIIKRNDFFLQLWRFWEPVSFTSQKGLIEFQKPCLLHTLSGAKWVSISVIKGRLGETGTQEGKLNG